MALYWRPEEIITDGNLSARLILFGSSDETVIVDSIGLSADESTCDPIANLPVALQCPIAFKSQGVINVCGGKTGPTYHTGCWKYNSLTNAWDAGSNMILARMCADVLQVNGDEF